jgi:hypothetical protein
MSLFLSVRLVALIIIITIVFALTITYKSMTDLLYLPYLYTNYFYI